MDRRSNCVASLIHASRKDLNRAHAVNAAKAALKAVCAPLQGIRIRIPVKDHPTPTKAIPAIRVILRNIQRSDLKLLAAYRRIPILGKPPSTVTYTRANTRAVYARPSTRSVNYWNLWKGPPPSLTLSA